jgi:hypothetical protein
MIARLTGKRVLIRLSDPWDLGESFGWEPLGAEIVAIRDNAECGALLLRLENPFIYKDVRCEYFVATPRHEGTSVQDMVTRKSPVLCGITCVSEDRLEAEDPFDLSWWRGGVAGIGDVTVTGDVVK